MTATPCAAFDCRMIRHSGIGVVVRHLLGEWLRAFPDFRLELLGPEEDIRREIPRGDRSTRIVPWSAPVYGPAGLLGRPPVRDANVFFSPHYAAPLRLDIPLVAMVHDLIHITNPPRPGTSLYMKGVLALLRRKARYIVTPSRHTKVQLQTLHGFEPQRVLTYANGPGLGGTKPMRTQAVESFPEKFLLAVGLWKPHKNWDFLIGRLGKLTRAGKISVPLVVAGMEQDSQRFARELARQSGLEVFFAPQLTDGEIVRLYEKATALVFPSLAEGFGFPVIEAMSRGTPVLIPDLPPMTDIAGGAALRFDPDSAESFDKAVPALLNDRELRQKMGDAGRRRATEFSWARYAAGVEETLRRALAE